MNMVLKIISLFLGTGFAVIVTHLLITKKIGEKISLLWLIGSVVVFIISAAPGILDKLAKIIGIDYPPSLLFLISTLILLFITLVHSIQISILNDQIKELTQVISINNFDELQNVSSKLKEICIDGDNKESLQLELEELKQKDICITDQNEKVGFCENGNNAKWIRNDD